MKHLLCILSIFALGLNSLYADETETSVIASESVSSESENELAQMSQQQMSQNMNQVRWYKDYQQALSAAQNQHKPLLLFFTGSDWCGWCKKMDQEVFQQPEFVREVGNDFIFVDVDFPMNHQLSPELAQQNTELKQKYGVTGYPTIIILGPNENFIAETGYRPGGAKAYAEYLRQLLQ